MHELLEFAKKTVVVLDLHMRDGLPLLRLAWIAHYHQILHSILTSYVCCNSIMYSIYLHCQKVNFEFYLD